MTSSYDVKNVLLPKSFLHSRDTIADDCLTKSDYRLQIHMWINVMEQEMLVIWDRFRSGILS